MTRREKLQASITDDTLWDYICMATTCIKCPVLKICKKVESSEEFKAWLDEEVEDTVFEKENALKLIDSLMTMNGTLRRELVMSDAIASIGKETE